MSKFLFGGSLNSKGFSSQVSSGELPNSDHITYPGVFNEMDFEVGHKTDKIADLHFGFARACNLTSSTDQSINQFLAVFVKGKSDGEPRDDRLLNSVIILDVSGSMGGKLTKLNKEKSRLDLAKDAIKMFISKLRDTDSVGIVTFNNFSQTILKGIKKADLNMEQVFSLVDDIKSSGGTTLKSGFDKGLQVLQQISFNCSSPCENRLIMLTDVGDNSMLTTNNFINQVAKTNIHTTIIGISDDFRSDICQELINIKGFNYFCAVEVDDLKKYLFQNFDWTFFPSAYNLQISISSENIRRFEVFGTSDSKKINEFNKSREEGTTNFIITKTTSNFPSQIVIQKGIVKTVGGLILIKLSPQNHLQSFDAQVELKYRSIEGKQQQEIYPVKFQFPKNEQFFSSKCVQEGISAFYFVHEIKGLIDKMNKEKIRFQINKQNYLSSLTSLQKIAPLNKRKDVESMISLIQKYSVKHQEEQSQMEDLLMKLKNL